MSDGGRDGGTSTAASGGRLPDFIIGGAPKCGTTSLHFILDQHPDIGLPEDEVNFLDADDPINWPDFFSVRGDELHWRDPRAPDGGGLDWYRSRFDLPGAPRLTGEDSTRYLFSPVVAHRVRDLLPEARVIFMLRDPVARAWSQYWHDMKMSRETRSFEAALTRSPSIVACSTYAPHLRHWFDVLGRDRIKVVLFEDFVADRQAALDEVVDFIGAPPMDGDAGQDWFNRTLYPVHAGAQRLVNRIGRHVARQRYRTHMAAGVTGRDRLVNRIYQNWFHRLTPLLIRSTRKPAMAPGTRAFLTAHLRDRNRGLSDLVGRDLAEVWPSWRDQEGGAG